VNAPAARPTLSAEDLNRDCLCRTLDSERLRRQLEREPSLAGLADEITATRPHLFSATAVFLSAEQLQRMAEVVEAVEAVAALPAFRRAALSRAPAVAARDPGALGVFMGYDFHLTAQGPQLIEINTNAGGALLNAALAHAQQVCCRDMEDRFRPSAELEGLEQTFFDMFLTEWRRSGRGGPLGRVAIVDEEPAGQYLHPEFRLFEKLFRRHGVDAVIADPRELQWREGRLWHGEGPVDLVYNRLTDFYLEAPAHAALRSAYEADAVVLTPHPFAHALYADKRNLITFSDGEALTTLGAPAIVRDVLLAGIPRTEQVTPDRADDLWARRKQLFFKPASGFGSRAAYRGDKVTKRVWEEILAGDYVAQAIAPPSERATQVDGLRQDLKLDVRVYAYGGAVQLAAARLYSGQTTNFRTPGGGFAPVFVLRR
jgi:hypothetical protein